MFNTIFGQFMTIFHFLQVHRGYRSPHTGPSEMAQYKTKHILKSFLLWIIAKKTTMNKSLNVKLYPEPRPTEKVP